MELSKRQEDIIEIVKKKSPITSGEIAKQLGLSRAALRPDLSILTMVQILDAKPKVGYEYRGKSQVKLWLERFQKVKVEGIKTEAVSVKESSTLYDAIIVMFLKDVGTVFVESELGSLVGVVSRKDILKCLMGGNDINKAPVGIVMTRMPNVITIGDQDSILDAAKMIEEHQINCLPVVERIEGSDNNRFRIVGRLSKTNIIQFIVRLAYG